MYLKSTKRFLEIGDFDVQLFALLKVEPAVIANQPQNCDIGRVQCFGQCLQVSRCLRHNKTVFCEMAAQGIDQLRPLAQEQIAGPEGH